MGPRSTSGIIGVPDFASWNRGSRVPRRAFRIERYGLKGLGFRVWGLGGALSVRLDLGAGVSAILGEAAPGVTESEYQAAAF